MLRLLRARVVRWRHRLICRWRGTWAVTLYTAEDRIVSVRCTCGRVFYQSAIDAVRSEVH